MTTHTDATTSPELLAKALGSVMRAYRERTGKSQERFANDHGLAAIIVSTMETGKRNPTFAKLAEHLDALGGGFTEFGRDLDRALHEQQERR